MGCRLTRKIWFSREHGFLLTPDDRLQLAVGYGLIFDPIRGAFLQPYECGISVWELPHDVRELER